MAASTQVARSASISRRDIQFLVHEWLDAQALTEHSRYAGQSRELFDEVFELSDRIATERFAPHNALADANEPYMDDTGSVVLIPEVAGALDAFTAAGL